MILPMNRRLGSAILIAVFVCSLTGWIHAEDQPKKPRQPAQTAVRYADFGAVGDGKVDDLQAIAAAHAHANKERRPVRADDGATYYLGGAATTVIVETDTDFGQAKFIIDDTRLQDRRKHVFEVRSTHEPIKPKGITALKKGQAKLKARLTGACVVVVTDRNVRRYIRRGGNANKGSHQTDVFVVDQDGNVDPNTPILWDFEQVTGIVAYPMDKTRLTITGGHFTTIANRAESKYSYHARGLAIRRSNVLVRGVRHHVTGEGKSGAPYGGFINVGRCANVIVRDTVLTGRKTYRTMGRGGRMVSMGSYDISLNRAMNVSFINVTQTNDIHDRRFWGIMGSNFCKNLTYEGCTLSRFDAHQGVANATIRNSTLGYMGINAIGSGTLLVENTTVRSGSFINLRSDYGSTWDGEFVIRNCVFRPRNPGAPALIGGRNDGRHDFGYTCTMPHTITIQGLRIEDARSSPGVAGPAVFGNFNPAYKTVGYDEAFPYVKTKRVILKDVTTASGKPLRVSANEVMFRNVNLVTGESR